MSRPRLPGTPVWWLSGLLVAVLAAWASVTWINSLLDGGGCTRRTTVEVVAAPDIAPALAAIARDGPDVAGCTAIRVAARGSAGFADTLAAAVPGEGPQVWVPESTFWLGRARARGGFTVPGSGTSIAASPVVVGMTEPVATRLGWPARPVGWAALLGADVTGVTVGLPEPATDPVGVAGLIGVQAVTAGRPDAEAARTAVLRRLSRTTLANGADLYEHLTPAATSGGPGTPAATSGGPGTLDAIVTSEQAMTRHNAVAAPLVAAYPDGPVPTLDYPYVVLPDTDATGLAAATAFLERLLSPAARARLRAEGFRGPDGTPPTTADRTPPATADDGGRIAATPVPAVPMPSDDALVQLLNSWAGVHLSARILTLVDVSGSMNERLPDGQTRLAATIRATQEGVGLLLDTTELGIWLFSTRLDGSHDYRVLAAARPLGEQRTELVRQLGEVRATPDGDTGLYDSTLAAYQEARRTWSPGRINLVLVLTDGRNDDDASITRAQLLAELKKLDDPRRPLPVLFIGIGGGIDAAELNDIAAATGGRVFLSPDPGGIRQIFFTALAELGCQPPACRRT